MPKGCCCRDGPHSSSARGAQCQKQVGLPRVLHQQYVRPGSLEPEARFKPRGFLLPSRCQKTAQLSQRAEGPAPNPKARRMPGGQRWSRRPWVKSHVHLESSADAERKPWRNLLAQQYGCLLFLGDPQNCVLFSWHPFKTTKKGKSPQRRHPHMPHPAM